MCHDSCACCDGVISMQSKRPIDQQSQPLMQYVSQNLFMTLSPHASHMVEYSAISASRISGEYAKKTWAHFDEVKAQLLNIHLAHSPEMRDALIAEYSAMWDAWGDTAMDKFWDTTA